jgi:hypothetical protein
VHLPYFPFKKLVQQSRYLELKTKVRMKAKGHRKGRKVDIKEKESNWKQGLKVQ